MKIKQTLLMFAALIGICGFLFSPVAFATDCGGKPLKDGQSCCGGVATSIISCNQAGGKTDDVTETGIWALLLIVINILTAGIGVAAVAGVVYSSVLYTSAGGNVEQVKKSRDILKNTAIGVVTYALMYSALNFIIPGGMFK